MSLFLQPKLTSPFYFARKGLFNAAKLFAGYTKGGKLLDFGCGSKPYKSLFNVDEYIGIDFENEGHPHDEEQIDIFYSGTGALPFNNEQYDYLLCTEVFEHLFDLDEKLIEFNRILKKGGLMFVTCPFVWNEHEVPYDYARYTRFALNDKFNKAGFDIIEYKKEGRFFETHTQLFFLVFSTKEKKFKSDDIGFFKTSVIYMVNVFGKLLTKIMPDNDSFYLSNVYVVKKR